MPRNIRSAATELNFGVSASEPSSHEGLESAPPEPTICASDCDVFELAKPGAIEQLPLSVCFEETEQVM